MFTNWGPGDKSFGSVISFLTADLFLNYDPNTNTADAAVRLRGGLGTTLYKLSWPEYQYAKQIVTVKTVTMPNLLAGEEVFPEFIQHAATPKNISDAALMLLKDDQLRTKVNRKLAQVIALLGGPGASQRAANAIVELLP